MIQTGADNSGEARIWFPFAFGVILGEVSSITQSSLLTNPSHLELFSVIMLIYCDVCREFAVKLIWANATKLFCYEPCRECWLDYTGHVWHCFMFWLVIYMVPFQSLCAWGHVLQCFMCTGLVLQDYGLKGMETWCHPYVHSLVFGMFMPMYLFMHFWLCNGIAMVL